MRRPSGPAIAVIVLVVVPALLALYVLSSGPVYGLNAVGRIDKRVLWIYRPLDWCEQRSVTLRRALKRYSDWWIPDDRTPPMEQ